MKITMQEYDGCFSFDMTAETLADAALLTRFGMNRTDEIKYGSTLANQNGTFEAGLAIGKSARADSTIPKRK